MALNLNLRDSTLRNNLLILIGLLLSTSAFGQSVQQLTEQANQRDPNAQYQLSLELAKEDGEAAKADAFYWLQQSAQLGYEPAQIKLAQAYESGIATQVDLKLAANWYWQAAVQGNLDAQIKLGTLFEEQGSLFSQLDIAQFWFGIASKHSAEAEDAYNRILEIKFNAMRAKQVSAISQLDSALKAQTQPLETGLETSAATTAPPSPIYTDWFSISIILLLALFFSSVMFYVRRKKVSRETTQLLELESELKRQRYSNKQLKRQLEKVFSEYKKVQSQAGKQKLSLACAMFGYSPSAIPDEKSIKIRFRQLSRLYHPDARGSEEEMKRLNGALKVLLQNVANS